MLFIAAIVTVSASCRRGSGASGLSGAESATPPAPALSRTVVDRETHDMLDVQKQREHAVMLMMRFADRTGLTSERTNRRYLWTDAFAVCNFVGLARDTGQPRYAELALLLVDRVHHTLGKHRPSDSRSGWISGLNPAQAEAHPTRGGLRIGKELPERAPQEPFDAEREWDRDGQYFHYLTKWMHALNQVARSTGKPLFNGWARELAATAHRGFVYSAGGRGQRRMYWKMSIDLSRPLVRSMGQHDALDGYVTYADLKATASKLGGSKLDPPLDAEMADFASMMGDTSLATDDPLGIGGLLVDAHRVDQLLAEQRFPQPKLRDALLAAALSGLDQYARAGESRRPAEQRLAFRELGLAIGIRAVASMRRTKSDSLLEELGRYDSLASDIIAFWLDPAHQRAATWNEHLDINEVMLATSLAPSGFLTPDF
ncbi:MAG TPA: hypothetical protein VF881_12225 [Polyangiaceae bacterium]